MNMGNSLFGNTPPNTNEAEDIHCKILTGGSEFCTCVKVTFEARPFGQGTFKGEYVDHCKNVQRIVVKKFKPRVEHTSDWKTYIKTAERAAELAEEFNVALGCRCINIEEFMRLNVTKCNSPYIKLGATVAAECFLDGSYKKWIGNGGYVNRSEPSDYLPAFSH